MKTRYRRLGPLCLAGLVFAGAAVAKPPSPKAEPTLDAALKKIAQADHVTFSILPGNAAGRAAYKESDFPGAGCTFITSGANSAAISDLLILLRAGILDFQTPSPSPTFEPRLGILFDRQGVELARLVASDTAGRGEMTGHFARGYIHAASDLSAKLRDWEKHDGVTRIDKLGPNAGC